MTERTRFAPSPTGPLHLGHAHAALFAHRLARSRGGSFLLRMEDIDATRCRPEHADAALADLAWLGLAPDEPVRVQSRHLADYAACLDRLAADGLLYPCFCTRAEVRREIAALPSAPHDPDGAPVYPGTCRALPPGLRAERIARGDPSCLRLDTGAALARIGGEARLSYRHVSHRGGGTTIACRPSRFGDVVLGRRDAPVSYHLAVTHDDAASGITTVTRGEDLATSTDVHRLLQALFDWPVPDYQFHALLRDPSGRRLAKRDGARSLQSMREAGMSADTVRALAGFPAGKPPRDV